MVIALIINEQQPAEIAAKLDLHNILSHQTRLPMKLVSQVIPLSDAYLSPILASIYRSGCCRTGYQLMFMQSNGRPVSADLFQARTASFPGLPVVSLVVKPASRQVSRTYYHFDMGGTSTDAAHFRVEYEHPSTHKRLALEYVLLAMQITGWLLAVVPFQLCWRAVLRRPRTA